MWKRTIFESFWNYAPDPIWGGGFRLKPHIEVSFKWMWFHIGICQSPKFLTQGGLKEELWYRREVYDSSLTSALTAKSDIVVTMFAAGKIDKDTVNCPRCGAFKGASWSREDSSSSYYSRTAREQNPKRKRRFWRGRSIARPAQRSPTAGAILLRDAKRDTISLETNLYVQYWCCWGGGGGGGGGEGRRGGSLQ